VPVTINTPPSGRFDAVTATAVDGVASGWAYDPDSSSSTSIAVHVYFYPPSGSPIIVPAITSGYRSDVNAAYGLSGYHGFYVPVPKSLYNGSTYTVRAYGIDAQDPSGSWNVELTNSPRTMTYANQPPIGTQDVPMADGSVYGWAYDPNHPSETQVVHVQYYNTTTWALLTTIVTSTTGARPDVNSAYGITGNHGYLTRYCNGQQLYAVAYAFDLNSGTPTNLGGRYVAACQ
jgi:hypothetical protein